MAGMISKKSLRRIMIFDHEASKWSDYLRSFFEETPARIIQAANASKGRRLFDRLKPDMCFVNPEVLSPVLTQKIKVRCKTDEAFHLFSIGDNEDIRSSLPYLCHFEYPNDGLRFLHQFSNHLKLPEQVRILIADDDPEIRSLITEYLEESLHPVFKVVPAEDGEEAIWKIKQLKPDFALLDFCMPQKDGREVYAFIQSLEPKIPVIIYFDVFSSHQVTDLYRIGHPLILDKSGVCNSMTNLIAFVKKIFYLESA